MIALRTRRLLFGCVVSNAVIGIAGLIALPAASTTLNASSATPTTIAATPSSIAAAPTSEVTNSTAPAASASVPQTSSTPRSHARTSTTAAVSAGDVTGITSSAAPSTAPARITPAAGNYPVAFSGTSSVNGKAQSVPATGTIYLTKSGNDVTQKSPDAPGDVVLVQRFSSNQASLVSLQLTASDTTKTFSMPSPVTYLLFNSPAGTSWNWTADSTDGKTHVSASGTVAGTENIVINGVTVPTVQLTTNITISGDITGTAQLTTWVSPSLRIPAKQRQVIDAKAKKGFITATLKSDVTTTLTKLAPQ